MPRNRIILGVALAALFLLVIGIGYTPRSPKGQDAKAANEFFIVSGYAWNSKAGWIKQRGIVGDAVNKIGNYGVRINKTTGEVDGWSWSSIYGWVCWGVTCGTHPALVGAPELYGAITPPAIPGYEPTARAVVSTLVSPGTLDTGTPENNKLTGWAKIIGLGDAGWVKLSGDVGDGSGATYFTFYNTQDSQFNGWAWNCVQDAADPDSCDEATSIGWIAFSGKTLADFAASGACPTPGLCDLYSFDTATGQSKWYTEVIAPWLETQGGDIYGRDELKNPVSGLKPPILNGGFNASYLIHSNGAIGVQWQSECLGASGGSSCGPTGDRQTPKTPVGAFESPKAGNNYRNQLGSINIAGLTDTVIDLATGTNAFGYKVKTIAGPDDAALRAELSAPLNGTVLYRNGNLDIGSPTNRTPITVFKGGSSTTGAGTIVINGDLRLYAPIRYDTSAIVEPGLSIIRTPSIAWIVLGDIIIDDCIPSSFGAAGPALLSGAYIAEGKISTGHGGSSQGDQGSTLPTRCQAVADGGSFADFDIPLQVNGLMMAQEYEFQRVYTGNDTGSESIRDDGRLFANTPPGLDDLAKSLPLWRSNRFSP